MVGRHYEFHYGSSRDMAEMSTGDAGSTSCNFGKQSSHSQARLVCPEGRYKLDSKDIELIPVVLDSGTGSSGGKTHGGRTSSMWWMIALAVSPGGLPDLATFFCQFKMLANLIKNLYYYALLASVPDKYFLCVVTNPWTERCASSEHHRQELWSTV